MASPNFDLICWNVRGLNTPARCITVHEMMSQTFCHLACFQETKLPAVDGPLAAYLGGYKRSNFVFKAAAGTRGGILLLWNDSYLELADIHIRSFSITAVVTLKECSNAFTITVVYGPARDVHKPSFLRELRRSKPAEGEKWLVLVDFNLIYRARDKNGYIILFYLKMKNNGSALIWSDEVLAGTSSIHLRFI